MQYTSSTRTCNTAAQQPCTQASQDWHVPAATRRTFAALASVAAARLATGALSAFATGALAGEAGAGSSAAGDPAPANVITPPEFPGALPLSFEGPHEVDLGDVLVIATPYYAVSLPKELLGADFSWEWDDAVIESTTNATGDAPAENWYPSRGFLTVNPGEGGAAFKVYTQGYGPMGLPLEKQTVLGPDFEVHKVGYNGNLTFVGTAPGEDRWVKFVSAGGYAFTREEAEGTRIYTPLYSVLVRPGWIDDRWCYTYNHGTTYKTGSSEGMRLDIYATPEEREVGMPAMSYLCYDPSEPHGDSSHRSAYATQVVTDRYYDWRIDAISWETSPDADDWVDAWHAAELWADCLTTEITSRTLQLAPTAVTEDLWHVETPYFSLDVPEFWRGRVQVRFADNGNVQVFPNDLPRYNLVSVSTGPADHQYPGGDIGAGMLWGLDNGRGQYVYLVGVNTFMNNEYDIEYEGVPNHAPEVWEEIASLQSGGAYTAADYSADTQDWTAEMAFGYYEQAIAPAIEVAMDEEWALLAQVMQAHADNPTVAAFHRQVHAALDLGKGLDWVLELAERDDVREWAANYMPLASFVTETLPRFLDDSLELSGIACPVDPSFWDDEGQVTISFELAYEIDPQSARAGDLQQIGWHQSALSTVPHLWGSAKDLETAEGTRTAIEEQITWEMTRYEHPGIAFDLRWTYTLPDGTVLEGAYSC